MTFQEYMQLSLERVRAVENTLGEGPFYKLDDIVADLTETVPANWTGFGAKMIEYRQLGQVFFSSAGTPIVALNHTGRSLADSQINRTLGSGTGADPQAFDVHSPASTGDTVN